MRTRLAVPNAILFILDPSNKDAIVPEYTPGNPSAATSSCVSITTIADVDGEVTLRLGVPPSGDEAKTADFVQVFDGIVETPGYVLAVVTSELDCVLEVATMSLATRITVSVDDVRSIASVHVEVK